MIIDLNPEGEGKTSISGHLKFSGNVPWPVTTFSPGAMGWYSFIPVMQCYHGVLSMNHKVSGEITVNNTKTYSFESGKGYLEKDWGVTFPTTWIWSQANHFKKNPDSSLFLSVAHIPWFSFNFTGMLAAFWHEGEFNIFTTYTGASVKFVYFNETFVNLLITSSNRELDVSIVKSPYAPYLYAPKGGKMEKYLDSGTGGTMYLKFYDTSSSTKRLIYEDVATPAGVEMSGNIAWLADH
eukprot:TRINITY_DN6344_c0_g1_i1.p1 TRINITY_DN6344_c0_g1~~TRINITY_DN6344_c0_g1_i1.p1  ORF type:complete len:238 (+),score=34.08 TRINITY_DN6344_c0_g1_i1:427-1140(+)